MKSEFDVSDMLKSFSGIAPLFPLPNVVLFPHVTLPLHIFENRYRHMVADVLEGERLIALALLKPGWETCYEDTPPIHEMVCLGRISAAERLESGRYNLTLSGLERAVVVQELETDLPYRRARLELYRDLYPQSTSTDRDALRKKLLFLFRDLFPLAHAESMFARLFDADMPLGALCDILASALRMEPEESQALLEEVDVDLRGALLMDRLREAQIEAVLDECTDPFPPKFSLN